MAMLAQRVRPGSWRVAVTWMTLGSTRSGPNRSINGCSFSIPFWRDSAARGTPVRASSASFGLMGLDPDDQHVVGAEDQVAGHRPWTCVDLDAADRPGPARR